jgi:hypothetical protein
MTVDGTTGHFPTVRAARGIETVSGAGDVSSHATRRA